MSDYQNLSVDELQSVIENAEKALKNKLVNHRKDVIAQIKELAASIDISVEIIESKNPSSRAGKKVEVKYRHPENPKLTWTGRGMKPKWLKELVDSGRNISEFSV
jgi:DNA-binding protein H-NS